MPSAPLSANLTTYALHQEMQMKPLFTIVYAKCLPLLDAIVLFLSMRFTRFLVGLTHGHWLYYGTTRY